MGDLGPDAVNPKVSQEDDESSGELPCAPEVLHLQTRDGKDADGDFEPI